MFFIMECERNVTLHPSYFGKNMHDLVTSKLLRDVEGTCTGSYYIITIMDSFTVSEGRILPSSGLAEFTVNYRAVVWRPFKGETVNHTHPSWTLRSICFSKPQSRLMPLSRLSTNTVSLPMLGLFASLSLRTYVADITLLLGIQLTMYSVDTLRYQMGPQRYATTVH